MRYETAQVNRLGNRPSNQDRFAIVTSGRGVLLVLADGMGGHARGDLAAQVLVDTFEHRFRASSEHLDDPAAFLGETLLEAHDQVVEAGRRQHPPADARTTGVACLVRGRQAWWVHAGDSRLYLLRAGRIRFHTRDHTYVEDLYRLDVIDARERDSHPLRNYITQCVGGEAPPEYTTGHEDALQPGDVLLLCSDGLWDPLGDGALAGLAAPGPLDKALDDLAYRAEAASYPFSDNISAVALRWLSDDPPADAGSGGERASPENRAAAQPGAEGGDELSAAIETIHQAIREFEEEMKRR